MGSIRVVSKRKNGIEADPSETVIDVDRSHPVLGNPFFLADPNNDAQRADVIRRYSERLQTDWARGGPMSQAIRGIAAKAAAGERVALRCWCAPKPCHADLLKDLVVSLVPGIAEEIAEAPPKRQMALF